MGKDSGSPVGPGCLVVLLFFLLSGLLVSFWTIKSKIDGKGWIGKFVLSVLCIVVFGCGSGYLYFDYMTGESLFVYYLSIIGFYANALAVLVLIITLFV